MIPWTSQHGKVDIRGSHPGLYHSIMTLSVMSVALALNFWISNPTFNPYGISKNIIGGIFAALGIAQIIFLNVARNLRQVRLTLATSLGFFLFWGLSNTQQFFAGSASLQLPILYVTVSILHVPLLIESPINATTKRLRNVVPRRRNGHNE